MVLQALKKTEGSVYDSPRAMAKLLKEAQRVKQVLSANTDHFAQVNYILPKLLREFINISPNKHLRY